MKLIIFDFEVFKYDTLLGCYILENDSITKWQSWDLNEIKKLYQQNLESIWIGWNIEDYDNIILQTVCKTLDQSKIKKINDSIIAGQRHYLNMPLIYYDLICNHHTGLKTIEAFVGKNISESEVDFNLDRPLTEEEKRLTESYNLDDLDQTYDNFVALYPEFSLRLQIIKEFGLSLKALNVTGTQVAEMVLKAEQVPGIENMYIAPKMYDCLKLNNQLVKDFYLNETFRTDEKLKTSICGVNHSLGCGGIHGARKKYHADWAYYFDVSGYYNLIMINFDLLPRTIPDSAKKDYKFMYHEQLRLKKIDPQKRKVYKPILLAVFGAQNNKDCKFYDPYKGKLVTITGQIFLVDLLEKLEGKIELIQSNTDGVIAKPLPNTDEQEILDIIDEWQKRTGFNLKLEKIYNIQQRDVNNYMYVDDKNEVHVLGEAVKHYHGIDSPFKTDGYNSKEALIIAKAIVDYYIYNKLPEQTIEENKNNLRYFQYICKKNSFDWMEYEETNLITKEVTSYKIQNVNRAFALKSDTISGMIYKMKSDGKKAKVSNLPDSIFVYNNDIRKSETIEQLQSKIDYDYYINRSYERILEFSNFKKIKDILYE